MEGGATYWERGKSVKREGAAPSRGTLEKRQTLPPPEGRRAPLRQGEGESAGKLPAPGQREVSLRAFLRETVEAESTIMAGAPVLSPFTETACAWDIHDRMRAMRTRIQKWGNSQGFRVTKALLDEAGIRVGDEVDVYVRRRRIIIEPVSRIRGRYDLKDLVSKMPEEYRPKEFD